MSVRDCAFIFEMFGVVVRETPFLDANPPEVVGFIIRRRGERDLIVTRDAEPLAKNWTRLAMRGPKADVMPLVFAEEPLPEHGRG